MYKGPPVQLMTSILGTRVHAQYGATCVRVIVIMPDTADRSRDSDTVDTRFGAGWTTTLVA